MAKPASLGIKRLEGIHYYVYDIERSRRFYGELMDFAEMGESSPELDASAASSPSSSARATSRSSAPRPSGRAAAPGAGCRSTPTASAR